MCSIRSLLGLCPGRSCVCSAEKGAVKPMRSWLFAFLSRDWAGLVVAGILALFGAGSFALAGDWTATSGWVMIGAAVVSFSGAARHLICVSRVRQRHPPPGRMVDVGGYRLHVFAEGDSHGRPSIVWFPGAHGGAFALHHLHRRMRTLTRSILVDRPGAMWSDVGPFPIRTAVEADAVLRALDISGEGGPFIFVGHSLGGLLAANVAKRRPDLTAAVVLLDATHPDGIFFGPRLFRARSQSVFRAQQRQMMIRACARLFGLYNRTQAPEAMSGLVAKIYAELGSDVFAAGAVERNSRSLLATISIYDELLPKHLTEVAEETVVYDRDLEGLKVLVVAPRDEGIKESLAAGDAETLKLCRFSVPVRDRYLATSSTSRRIYSPEGTGHNFPYETPELVVEILSELVGAHL